MLIRHAICVVVVGLLAACTGTPTSSGTTSTSSSSSSLIRSKPISFEALAPEMKTVWSDFASTSGNPMPATTKNKPKSGKWQVLRYDLTKKDPLDPAGLLPFEIELKFEDDKIITVGGIPESNKAEFATNKWDGGGVWFNSGCFENASPRPLEPKASCVSHSLLAITETKLVWPSSMTQGVYQEQALWVSD